MIVPVRCFTCGKVIADKWETFRKSEDQANAGRDNGGAAAGALSPVDVRAASDVAGGDGARARALDELGLTKLCCRRHMLTNVDLMELI